MGFDYRIPGKSLHNLLSLVVCVVSVSVARFFFYCNFVVIVFVLFSILGMELFGGQFCNHIITREVCTCEERRNTPEMCECDRTNFDSLKNSVGTVFQVLSCYFICYKCDLAFDQ